MLHQPTFGRRLRELRREQGLSQGALGGKEISAAYLSRLESGSRHPTPRVAEVLATRLGVTVTAFEDRQDPTVATLLAGLHSAAETAPADTAALGRALREDAGLEPAIRWQAIWALVESGDPGTTTEDFELVRELVSLANELGVPELRGRSHTLLSRRLRMAGRYEEARDQARLAVEAARSADVSISDQAASVEALIAVEGDDGRLTEARRHADELLHLVEGTDSSILVVRALWANATVRYLQGEHGEAVALIQRALELADAREDLTLWIRLRLASSSLFLHVSPPDPVSARSRLEELEPVLNLLGEPQQLQEYAAQLAHLAFAEGDVDLARQRADELLARRDLLLTHRDQVRLTSLQGRLLILSGARTEGVAVLRQLAEDARGGGLSAEVFRTLAETLEASLAALDE